MLIAPQGQEASYMALSLLPYFLAKLVCGGMSGWLLRAFCPDGPNGVHRTESFMIWLVVGGMALITPVGAFCFRKYIQVQESGREPAISTTEAAAVEEEAGHG